MCIIIEFEPGFFSCMIFLFKIGENISLGKKKWLHSSFLIVFVSSIYLYSSELTYNVIMVSGVEFSD